MRNFGNHAIHILMWVSLVLMVYMIYGVLSQPMVYGAEKQEILKPGHIPQAPKAPQIDSKRFSRSAGYLYDPQTGTTQYVELRSYQYGNQTYYIDHIGHANIRIELVIRQESNQEK